MNWYLCTQQCYSSSNNNRNYKCMDCKWKRIETRNCALECHLLLAHRDQICDAVVHFLWLRLLHLRHGVCIKEPIISREAHASWPPFRINAWEKMFQQTTQTYKHINIYYTLCTKTLIPYSMREMKLYVEGDRQQNYERESSSSNQRWLLSSPALRCA